MTRRISDFFLFDLLEEQHKWKIPQIAFFYQTTEDEVISALARANEKYATNPLSTDYCDPDSDSFGSISQSDIEELQRAVLGDPGEGGAESGQGVVAGGEPP